MSFIRRNTDKFKHIQQHGYVITSTRNSLNKGHKIRIGIESASSDN